MAQRVNKGIRLTEEELERVQLLLRQLPDYDSESDLLVAATRRGLLLLAAEANRPGLPQYAGYDPADLATLLKSRIMPALELLIKQNTLPMLSVPGLVGSQPVPEVGPTPITAPAEGTAAIAANVEIDAQAAAELEEFGSGLLD